MDEYVNATEVAKLIGLSVRRVQQLTADGVLPGTDRTHGRKYNLEATIKAYIEWLKNQAENAKGGNSLKRLQEEKLKAEIELKQSQGELHQLKTQIAQGKYISVEEAQLEYQRFFVVFKKFALAIAPRVGGLVGAHVDPVTARALEKELSTDINNQLREFVFAGTKAKAESESKPKRGRPRKCAETKKQLKA